MPRTSTFLGGGVAALILVAAVVWLLFFRQPHSADEAQPGDFAVAFTDTACEPADLTVPAGGVSFHIVNRGTAAGAWQIRDGASILDKRDAIGAGAAERLTVHLDAGDYDIACGAPPSPGGRLHVGAK